METNADELKGQIGAILRKVVEDQFHRIWLRCWMLGGSPSVSIFVQPDKDSPKVYGKMPESEVSWQLSNLLSNFSIESTAVPRWSTLTLIINHSGETEAAYGIENLGTINTYKLQKEWTAKYFAGLEFVREPH